jgi:type IV pilus assembly protein PilV
MTIRSAMQQNTGPRPLPARTQRTLPLLPMSPDALPIRSRSQGATLVEVLVALLILSVGLLGIAALYVDNLRNGRTGVLRTQAAQLAADMAERVRTNRAGGASFARVTGQRCRDLPSTPTADEAAANEVACWQEEVAKVLPNGTGLVALDSTTVPATYTVTVSWSETGAGTASYVVRVQT